MSLDASQQNSAKFQSSIWIGVLLYLVYLAVFFTTWTINGVDYNHIGQNAETIKLWYALPTLLGGAFLVLALSILGWWRVTLFDTSKSGPKWLWVLPIAMAALILNNFAGVATANLSAELLIWSLLGAVGVGFGEEMITRGSMVVGLRGRFSEGKVWLISSLLFSALHIPNVFFGLSAYAMPIQVLLTLIMGSGFYVMRRMSGTLLLPMVLHGLWDSALFLNTATGGVISAVQLVIYPLAIVCTVAFVWKDWNAKLSP